MFTVEEKTQAQILGGFSGEKATNRDINTIIGDKVDQLITELSGKEHVKRVKIIDNFIVFTGAKGGTGTSTILSNVAYEISKKGLTVLIIDLNIQYPIQHNIFQVSQKNSNEDLVSFLQGNNEIGRSIDSVGGNKNISLLCAKRRNMMDYINCDNESCSKNFIEAIERVRLLFDIIIIDCPMNIEHDVINSTLYNADMIYSVWDEGVGCVSNIDRIRKNLQLTGISTSKIRVIFNNKTEIYYPSSTFDDLNVKVLNTLPFDVAIRETGLKGEVFCDKGASISKEATEFVEKIGELTNQILELGGYVK